MKCYLCLLVLLFIPVSATAQDSLHVSIRNYLELRRAYYNVWFGPHYTESPYWIDYSKVPKKPKPKPRQFGYRPQSNLKVYK